VFGRAVRMVVPLHGPLNRDRPWVSNIAAKSADAVGCDGYPTYARYDQAQAFIASGSFAGTEASGSNPSG